MYYKLKSILLFIIIFFYFQSKAQIKTYCNPINIDYGYTPIPNFSTWGNHRATADPVIVQYKGDFYLFATNQWGYWWSNDLVNWHFIAKKFLRTWNNVYDELCAPAVGIIGDTMIVMGSNYAKNFTIWMSTNPKNNDWKPLVDSFEIGGWDPAFFTDDDGKLFMYNGSSNKFPLYGVELNRKNLQPIGTRKEMIWLEDWRYGWQRFGEHNDNTFLDPFIEGAWMTKHKNKYYLQFAAPGTEFSGYADGVSVSNDPLGYFVPQSDPLSIKAGGFARGAGHGATFKDNYNNFWHTSTIQISVKNTFERRIGLWMSGFDKDDIMFCNTSFGDYPHYIPDTFQHNIYGSNFTGWMLLNFNKPVEVSSTYKSFYPNFAVDENLKTYWSAETEREGEWIMSDLGEIASIQAIQINYADQDVEKNKLGKYTNQSHKYKLFASNNKKDWQLIMDKSINKTDIPHEYIEFKNPLKYRYIKLENIQMPTGKFAISGLRIFGKGNGSTPDSVKDFIVLRTEKDKRSAYIKWSPVDNAYAYNIYYGTSPDKLYNCIMLYATNEYWFKGMDLKKKYYFTIEAINENGVSKKYKVMEVE